MAANGSEIGPEGRIEPELEVPPRPAAASEPTLAITPATRLVSRPAAPGGKKRRTAIRWLVLTVLFALAILAGVVVARGAVMAMWPPAAQFYAMAGLLPESPRSGLKLAKLAPTRTPDGPIIEGEIANNSKKMRDIPRLRVALRDAADKEVQYTISDPPEPRLAPGAIARFRTPFDHPNDAATDVLVTSRTADPGPVAHRFNAAREGRRERRRRRSPPC
ncbi:MAG: FxLYD domain-containing protein [Stellaceae bacterium]